MSECVSRENMLRRRGKVIREKHRRHGNHTSVLYPTTEIYIIHHALVCSKRVQSAAEEGGTGEKLKDARENCCGRCAILMGKFAELAGGEAFR